MEDGNEPNSTADLRQFGRSFVGRTLASLYWSTLNVAFSYRSPYEKLAFSDIFGPVHILGNGTGASQIANAVDFARFSSERLYFNFQFHS